MSLLDTFTHKLRRKGTLGGFSTSGNRPSINDPTAWVNPVYWGEGLLRGHKPHTKEEFINAFTSWVYICVKLNAQAVASVPLHLYAAKPERGKKLIVPTKAVDKDRLKYLYSQADLDAYLTKSEEVEEITEHPFLDLMQNVNPYHNNRDLKEFTTMYSDLTGEAYWLIVRDQLVPSEIWPIPSQYMSPKYGKTLDKAIEAYIYKRGNVEVELSTDEVIHFAYPNPKNVFTGFSCVQGIADAVYIQSEMYATETALFENRARPGGILTSKDNISKPDRDRMKEDFGQRYEGSRKAGKTMLLPRGVDYTRDSMTPTELNYIEGRKLIMREICSGFDVPEAIFSSESSNRAVAEAAEYWHAKHGVRPRCERYSQKINEKLLPMYGNENTKIFCAFDNAVPEDRELLLKERQGYISSGVYLINEIRAEMGLEDVDGGDVPLVDSRLVPLGSTGQPEQPEPEQVEELAERAMKALRNRLGG